MRRIVFKTKVVKYGGMECVALPVNISGHHCAWLCSEFYRVKTLRHMRQNGLLPDRFFLDDLPEHVTVERGTLLTTVAIGVPDGA